VSAQILVVDDEHDLAVACERLLARSGWTVSTVATRAAALRALGVSTRLALAIIDRELPDGDGVDVVRAARARGTPVIVISAHTTSANRQHALDEGAAGFLAKPFSASQLLEMVRAVAGEAPRARR
jgi:DNA-binding response OmpR family regulator